MLTRAGWLVVLGSAATIVAGRVFAMTELFLIGATGLVLVALAAAWVRRPLPELTVVRSVHPDRVPHGGTSRVELEVANVGRRPMPILNLHDPVTGTVGATVSMAPLTGGEHHAASYRLPTEKRGLVRVGPLEGHLVDPFALARRRLTLAGEATLTVLPVIEQLGRRASRAGFDDPLTGAAQPVSGRSADEDFATLRPYVIGDDLRRVHWSSSARTGDLLVRQDDPPWQGRQTILLDARTGADRPRREVDDCFERAVSAAASLINAAAVRGDRCRLLLTDGTDTGTIDARAARDTFLEHLALVEPQRSDALPATVREGRNHAGTLTVVTRTIDEPVAQLLADQTRHFAAALVVVLEDDAPQGTHPGPSLPIGVEVITVAADASLAATWPTAGRRAQARR